MGARLAVAFALVAGMLLAGAMQNAIAASGLKVVANIAKKTVIMGDTQKTTIKVTDASGKAVKGASVTVTLSSPGSKDVKKFTGTTGSNGSWSFSYKIPKDAKAGLSGLDIQVSKAGYDKGFASVFYKVIIKKQK